MIPKKMRAVRLIKVGRLELQEIPVPRPGAGEVLIRVVRASVCNGSDGALYCGRREIPVAYPWMKLPWTIGHECAGEIVAVGPRVSGFRVGQRVASMRYGTAFADYQLVNIARDGLFALPDSLSHDEATFIEPLFATALYIPFLEKLDKVVLLGLGPSGIMFVEQILDLGVRGLICADCHDLRLDVARHLGARVTVNTRRQNLESIVKKKFGAADAFIDATGRDVYDMGIRLLRPDGKLILYGVPDGDVRFNGTLAFFKGTRFLIRPYDFKKPRVLEPTFTHIRRLLRKRAVNFTAHVTHHFPLEQTEQAIRLAVRQPGRCLGIVIDVA